MSGKLRYAYLAGIAKPLVQLRLAFFGGTQRVIVLMPLCTWCQLRTTAAANWHQNWQVMTLLLVRWSPLLAAKAAPGGELPGVLTVSIPTDRVHPGWGQDLIAYVG